MTRNPSVLIVDDDASGRTMLGLSLRQAGFCVRTAANGDEALHLLHEQRCDWLVTDARMYPVDGFELAERAAKLQPDLRIVMTSAIYTRGDMNGYPIEKFFPKPVPVDDLVTWLSA